MEEKLYRTAQSLPLPGLDFADIEAAAAKTGIHRQQPRPLFRLGLAMVLVLCLATTVLAYGSLKYGLWSGGSSSAYADVILLNWRYGLQFPEVLEGHTFQHMSTLHGAPEGATHAQALLSPSYTLYSLTYAENIGVSFGTTENPQWRYHFSVAEDGSCTYEGVLSGSQSTVEYRSHILYLYATDISYSVRWEDTERSLVITLHAPTQEEALTLAHTLIDLHFTG